MGRGVHPQKANDAFCLFPFISTKVLNFSPINAKFVHVPIFPQNLRFLLNLRVVASPYFDHDAFMHNSLLVLNTPACGLLKMLRVPCGIMGPAYCAVHVLCCARAVHGGNIRLFKDTFISKIIACLRALMQSRPTNLCGTTKEVKCHLTSLGTTGSLPAKTIYSQCFFQLERRSRCTPFLPRLSII